jgi:hypothetical protein
MSGPSGAWRDEHATAANVRCPFCGSADAEPFSLFGSQLLTEQWYCRACRTPFERVKDASASTAGRDPGMKPHEPAGGV